MGGKVVISYSGRGATGQIITKIKSRPEPDSGFKKKLEPDPSLISMFPYSF